MSNEGENQNALELLKQALMFYANSDNYKQTQSVHYELFSMIDVDNGSQARFALEQLEKIKKLNEGAEEEFVKNITNAIESGDSIENMTKLINDFKKMSEGGDNQ